MPADLRTRLKALVEEWHEEEKEERIQGSLMIAATLRACSKEVAALLAESEPEPSFRDITATRCLRHATIPPTILPPEDQECGVCMRDEGVLVGRSEQQPETAWLIESRFTPAPSWWTGTGWSRDSLEAVRFSRSRDAEAATAALPDFHTCFVTEHQWGFDGPDCEAKAKLPLDGR